MKECPQRNADDASSLQKDGEPVNIIILKLSDSIASYRGSERSAMRTKATHDLFCKQSIHEQSRIEILQIL
jgi:hypothetical protein